MTKQILNENIKKSLGNVGGMALIEGVMMKTKSKISMAVRKIDNIIEISSFKNDNWYKKKKLDKIPILRGCLAFFDSFISGIKAITDSAKLIDISDENGENYEITNKEITISVIIALVIAIGLFLALPNIVANLFFPVKLAANRLAYNLIETSLKLIIFLGYITLISNIREVKRLFMYHGAEHKAVNAYEAGEILSVETVKKYTRFHPRCGSSFIILVLLISFLVSYLIMIPNFWLRLVIKIVCLPLIAGLAYEIIRYNGKHINLFTKITCLPGILIQKITTKEPDTLQLEVAIAALYDSLEENNYITLKSAMQEIKKIDIKNKLTQNDMLRILEYLLKIDKNKLMTNLDDKYLTYTQFVNFKTYINRYILDNIPLQYIVEKQAFYGLDLYINNNVLVPRADTEILVSEAINIINNNNYNKVLDLCTGSGAIGIAIAKNTKISNITFLDISSKALNVCKTNLDKIRLDCNYDIIESNLFNNVSKDIKFDIIVSNPPYVTHEELKMLDEVVKHEPRIALDGGIDGLDYYRQIINNAKDYLNDEGTLIIEIGINQTDRITNLLKENGYSSIEITKDYNNKDRVIKCLFHKI